ncbi:MAG: hypothetical protein HQK83_02865 [Fibrobacteria bacterium]|nr:hypothetical protein [Fibrobacteria bacterium]
MKKVQIEQNVKKVLEQFERERPLQPDPWFYGRLKARIENQNKASYTIRGVLKPAFFALLLLVNIVTVTRLSVSSDTRSAVVQEQSGLISLLASDLAMNKPQRNFLSLQ